MNFIRVKGYLKNLTNKEITQIEATITKSKNRLFYSLEDANYEIIKDKNDLYLIRENKEIKCVMHFILNKHTTCDYTIKEKNIDLKIEIKTLNLNISETRVFVRYKVENTDMYEYLIEIEE